MGNALGAASAQHQPDGLSGLLGMNGGEYDGENCEY